MLCLRERETIKASPALASHAEKVIRSMEYLRVNRLLKVLAHIVIFRKRDIKSSSKQSKRERRCSRFIIIPRTPRKKRENKILVSMFIFRIFIIKF